MMVRACMIDFHFVSETKNNADRMIQLVCWAELGRVQLLSLASCVSVMRGVLRRCVIKQFVSEIKMEI